jgi:hypothetical protein
LLRNFFYTLPFVFLAACGFQPIYEKTERGPILGPLTLKVTGANQDGYTVYKLRSEIEPQLASLAALCSKPYSIQVRVQEEFGDIGYANDGTAIRAQGRMVAYVSVLGKTLTPVYEDQLDSVSSYTMNHGDEFSNLNAKDAVRERLIIDLSREIVQSVSGFLSQGETWASDSKLKEAYLPS